jgi:ferrochelatase
MVGAAFVTPFYSGGRVATGLRAAAQPRSVSPLASAKGDAEGLGAAKDGAEVAEQPTGRAKGGEGRGNKPVMQDTATDVDSPRVGWSNPWLLDQVAGWSAEGPPGAPGAEKVGVLLLNLGGPDTLDDVQPFLYNLFADPDIINLPDMMKWFQKPLAMMISHYRVEKSREAYASIGGGSPQRKITEAQGRALEEALKERGVNAKAYVGMRYWAPFTSDALAAMKRDGIERLVVLPLYPQFSISTSGSSLRELETLEAAEPALRLPKATIQEWYNRPGYINALAKLIAAKCDLYHSDRTKPRVFFSAHGVPERYVHVLNDPYQRQIEETVSLVMARLKEMGYTNDHTLAYQSKVGPVTWLQPYTEDAIEDLAAQGEKALVVVPISFVSEHIETLEEIDMEYAEVAKEAGITWWERVPALGTDPTFIKDLASAVVEVLPEPQARSLGKSWWDADDADGHGTSEEWI